MTGQPRYNPCRYLERMPVTLSPFAEFPLSEAKGLVRRTQRSFAALRMTAEGLARRTQRSFAALRMTAKRYVLKGS